MQITKDQIGDFLGGATRSLLLRADIESATDKTDLLSRIAGALCFPSDYRLNFDAVSEALSDLDWILIGSLGCGWLEHPERLVIFLSGVGRASKVIPEDVQTLLDLAAESIACFNEQNEEAGRSVALVISD